MRKEEVSLLVPGVRVQIGSKLLGKELYGWEDPPDLRRFLGSIGTVTKVEETSGGQTYTVTIEENYTGSLFLIEEIEYVIPDEELEESDESIDTLLGL